MLVVVRRCWRLRVLGGLGVMRGWWFWWRADGCRGGWVGVW